jgi:hypothetical protein
MKYITLKVIALMFVLMSVCPAFSQITLKYNLKQGEIFRQNIVTDMNLTQTLMGRDMNINVIMSMQMSFEIKEVKDGNYTLEGKYREMKVNMEIPGAHNIAFDSNTPNDIATQQDMSPMLKAMIDKPVEIVMTEMGQVESVKGIDKLNEAMLNSLDTNIPDAMKKQLTSQIGLQFSEEYFKSIVSQNSSFFPNKPVNPGDTWNHKLSATVSNFTTDADMNMRLKAVDGVAVILDVDGMISTPEGYEMEFTGMKAKASLKGSQKGQATIDKNTGWMISSKMEQTLSGEIEAMGMKVPLSVTSTVSVSNN